MSVKFCYYKYMLGNKKILIVEDEAQLRNALRDKLAKEGFNVFEAVNGEEGLAGALLEKPDVILLDIVMPIMDGMTMLKKLRADVWGKNAKVIMLTNLSTYDKIGEAVEQGSYDYLVKADWKIDDVVAKVNEKIEE